MENLNQQETKETIRDTRQEEIHKKGFSFYRNPELEYSKIKVGPKTLDDAVLNLGTLAKADRNYGNKAMVLQALAQRDIPTLRAISNYYYNTSGIYRRVCEYFAFLYRYDWYVVPEIFDVTIAETKVLKDFSKVLTFLDNSHIDKNCGDIALKVIRNGVYYGYLVEDKDKMIIQELPANYCRSRFFKDGIPTVEFNMRFFDDQFRDVAYRMKVLDTFPKEVQKAYLLYKKGKLAAEPGDPDHQGGWFLLDPEYTVKFNFNESDVPIFVNVVPNILDLDAAQDLDRRKQMQQLLKVVIQKLPLDKNGDLIFDLDEAQDIHNNAVDMLARAIGVDVLTTFADIDVADMSDKNTTTSNDSLERVERTLFNGFGTSRNLFNADGNLALNNSILNDESTVRNLLKQFEMFYDRITRAKNPNKKKYHFKLYFLETTQYNYKDLAKLYKEQVQIGYSKMLPQIAMGHSQSAIINTAYFENNILKLNEIMVPPLMSSTMSSETVLGTKNQSNGQKTDKSVEDSKEAGRKELPDNEKSEKTIANKESMN